MEQAYSLDQLKSIGTQLSVEFGVEIPVIQTEDGFTLDIPKEIMRTQADVEKFGERFADIAYTIQEQNFFESNCLVYFLAVDRKGRKRVFRNDAHSMLSDETLIERAHQQFVDVKKGFMAIGREKIRMHELTDVRIVRSIEQAKALDAELKASGY